VVIGIVGLGNMGLNMARTLLRGGCGVVGYDIRQGPVAALVELGGMGASSARQVAEEAETVILSLPNSPITEQVVLGEQGILVGVRPDTLVIDMGSSVPSSTLMLGRRLAQKGARMIDAPVSGGPQGARAGTLAIMVGGEQEDVSRAMPVLRMLGTPAKISIVGPLGSGHILKAINNYLYAAAIWTSAEAFVVAAKAGLDLRTVQQVLSTSSGHNRSVEDNIPREVFDRSFPASFALGLLGKDLDTFFGLAQELDVPTPVGALLKEMVHLGIKELGAEVGDSQLIAVLEKWAGVEVKA
jgi:3-hydroxyisobutyrate dehydrogenase